MPRKSFTHEQFIKRVEELVQGEYTVLSRYEKARTPLLMRHNICMHEYKVRPNDFTQSKRRCPKCAGSIPLTQSVFVERVKKLTNDEYSVLGDYQNVVTPILIKHNVCGHEFKMRPSNFMNLNHRCPKCSNIGDFKKVTPSEFNQRFNETLGDEYILLDSYKNARASIKVRHEKCGYEYKVRPDNILYAGQRCPKCKESKGEQKISEILNGHNYVYKRQYKIKECRHKNPLPFDFAIFDNNRLLCLVEYQGEQHFRPVEYWGGEKAFEEQKIRDKIKKDFCKQNKIMLIEIKYSVKDIEGYLLSELDHLLSEQLTLTI